MENLSKLTDEQLVSSYMKGNNAAFDTLIKRFESKVFTYIMYSVKDEDLANDLFQDVFVRVITTLKSGNYSSNGKFSSWLTCITHNILIDHFRQKSILRCTSKDDLESDVILNDASLVSYDNMENGYIERAKFDKMKSMIALLPELQREVIVMRFYQDMSFKEIAAITGVSINTTLGRMRYGLQTLRKLMQATPRSAYRA